MSELEELKNRRFCTLDESIIELLVKQLQHELYNKSLYYSMANFYDTDGLPLLGKYYRLRAEEEELHHKWIFEYLCYNDANFQYPSIPSIEDVDISDRKTPFEKTVDQEIKTTLMINKIVEKALELKDWATFNWLMGKGPVEGNLVTEQSEEESISRTICDMANENTPWLNKQKAIYEFYIND